MLSCAVSMRSTAKGYFAGLFIYNPLFAWNYSSHLRVLFITEKSAAAEKKQYQYN